jgi:hypothetical protein
MVMETQADHMDSRLILSMELYCAALLEKNEHARFVSAVSALEPLVEQEYLGVTWLALANFKNVGHIDASLRDSLRGRIASFGLSQFAKHSFDYRHLVSWAC